MTHPIKSKCYNRAMKGISKRHPNEFEILAINYKQENKECTTDKALYEARKALREKYYTEFYILYLNALKEHGLSVAPGHNLSDIVPKIVKYRKDGRAFSWIATEVKISESYVKYLYYKWQEEKGNG